MALALAGRTKFGRAVSPLAWSLIGLLGFVTSGVVVVATASVLAMHIS